MSLKSKKRARLHRLAVEQNRTRAAVAGITTNMRARQTKCFTQKIDQQLPGFHFSVVNLPVNSDSYLNALRSDRRIHAIPQPVRHDFAAAKLRVLFSPHASRALSYIPPIHACPAAARLPPWLLRLRR